MKKILAIVLCVLFLLGAFACSKITVNVRPTETENGQVRITDTDKETEPSNYPQNTNE